MVKLPFFNLFSVLIFYCDPFQNRFIQPLFTSPMQVQLTSFFCHVDTLESGLLNVCWKHMYIICTKVNKTFNKYISLVIYVADAGNLCHPSFQMKMTRRVDLQLKQKMWYARGVARGKNQCLIQTVLNVELGLCIKKLLFTYFL